MNSSPVWFVTNTHERIVIMPAHVTGLMQPHADAVSTIILLAGGRSVTVEGSIEYVAAKLGV